MARTSSKLAAKAPGKSLAAPEALMELIAQYSYQGKPSLRAPTNIVFWAGAGFSKAWEPTSPIGPQLFSIKGDLLGIPSQYFAIYFCYSIYCLASSAVPARAPRPGIQPLAQLCSEYLADPESARNAISDVHSFVKLELVL